jgi:hypothetical protein
MLIVQDRFEVNMSKAKSVNESFQDFFKKITDRFLVQRISWLFVLDHCGWNQVSSDFLLVVVQVQVILGLRFTRKRAKMRLRTQLRYDPVDLRSNMRCDETATGNWWLWNLFFIIFRNKRGVLTNVCVDPS